MTAVSDYVIVLTTLPLDTDAAEFAVVLVEERLAACVNVQTEMQSVYRWEGQIEQEDERQLSIKTTRDRLPALWDRVREMHPYEVPEFIVVSIIDGNDAYLKWIRESTTPGAEEEGERV